MELTVYTDGSSNIGKGTSGRGWLIYEDGTEVDRGFNFSNENLTNNQEEYNAIIEALEKVAELYPNGTDQDSVLIKTDSELVVRQLDGTYKIRKPHLRPLAGRIKELIRESPIPVRLMHIYRDGNSEADKLAREGLKEAYSMQE